MRVLSLFDGMSCLRIALDKLGITPEVYYASEIDKHAIKVSQENWPDIIHLGDVTKIDFESLGKIDLIAAGSPCQGFSFAGKQLNFDDPRSKLFFDFVRAVKVLKPKYFLLENVIMKQEFQDVISNELGVKPIRIESSLVSAQKRSRLYWTNIPGISQPEDKKIFLKDIVEDGVVDRDKSYCLDANYFKGTNLEQYLTKKRRQVVFNYSSSGRGLDEFGDPVVENRHYEADKAHTLTRTGYSKRAFTGVIKINDYKDYIIRKLTVLECKRLQTVPDEYKMSVSKSQCYKILGNGWTIDVIVHILKGMKNE